jgi:hypothetical protein
MTDEEYRALEYIRENTPANSVALTIGVEEGILRLQTVVSRRMMISITDLVDQGEAMIADMQITYSDLSSVNLTKVKVSFGADEGRYIYFIAGIRKVNSDIVIKGGVPPLKNVQMENLLTDRVTHLQEYECVYRNNQIVVFRSRLIAIHLRQT